MFKLKQIFLVVLFLTTSLFSSSYEETKIEYLNIIRESNDFLKEIEILLEEQNTLLENEFKSSQSHNDYLKDYNDFLKLEIERLSN